MRSAVAPSRSNGSRPREDPLPRAYVAAPPDTLLFVAVASLIAIGIVMVFSASSAQAYADTHDTTYYLRRQALWLVVGLAVAYPAYRVDYRKLRAAGPYVLLVSLMSLVAVLVPHVGVAVGGARRWIGAGFISFQPSEFAKLALVLYLSAVLAIRGDRVTSFSKGLFPLCLPTIIMVLLVLKEPDMGTASLLFMTAFVLFFSAGARLEHLALIVLATVPVLVASIMGSPYKRARIFAFINPWKDPQNTGFHIVQSLFALGSGGILGVGLGQSRAKFFYLPEQYTDFIFSVIGEELGLIGTLAVVLLFVIVAWRAIRIAIAAPDRFGFFLAIGCTALIVLQAFVNIGVATGSWPVTGVPLPFISFGGSALIVCLIAVALIMNVGRYRRLDAR